MMKAINHINTILTTLLKNEEGATAIEYGLLAALIAAVIVVAVDALGQKLGQLYSTVEAKLP